MTLLLVCVAIAVVGGVAVLVARDRPLIEDAPAGARRLVWPPEGDVIPADLDEVRFTVALRGYRMDEVDRVLEDAASALADRDRRIAELERQGAEATSTSGAEPTEGAEPVAAPAGEPTEGPEPTQPREPSARAEPAEPPVSAEPAVSAEAVAPPQPGAPPEPPEPVAAEAP